MTTYIRYPGTSGISPSSYPLLAPDGTAAAPSYSFSTSSGTGMYLAAADSLGFSTAGLAAGGIASNQSWVFGSSAMPSNASHTLYGANASGGPSLRFSVVPTNTGGAGAAIGRDIATGYMAYAGSNAVPSANGAAMFVYGESHATTPNVFQFYNGSTLGMTLDASSNLSVTGTVTASNLVVTSGNQTISGVKTFSGQLIGAGTATNDSAAAGQIGEIIEVIQGSTSVGTTAQFWDATSISLTAGDWDVYGNITYSLNGATMSGVNSAGISTTTGNSGTGLVNGSTFAQTPTNPTSAAVLTVHTPIVRASLASTTIYYLKGYTEYSAGTPKYFARFTARRRR